MMSTKHTPGPWAMSHQDPWDNQAVILDAHIMPPGKRARLIKHIATVEVQNAHGDSREGLANARLIAAAPDLLKACEDQCELLEHMHDELGPHRCTIDCPDIGKRTARARTAIAKAEGKDGG